MKFLCIYLSPGWGLVKNHDVINSFFYINFLIILFVFVYTVNERYFVVLVVFLLLGDKNSSLVNGMVFYNAPQDLIYKWR